MKKMKKIMSMTLALIMAVGCLAGCGGTKKTPGLGSKISSEAKQAIKEGKVVVSICNWPDKDASNYEAMEKSRTEFMEQNPKIFIEREPFKFDFKTFTSVAAANELPTMYDTRYTEIKKIINDGFAADITDAMEKSGLLAYVNEDLLPYTTDENGKVYALTYKAYNQGLYINKEIFRKAGLVDEAGNVLIPSTYEEIFEFSKIIKEKTGIAGFLFNEYLNYINIIAIINHHYLILD